MTGYGSLLLLSRQNINHAGRVFRSIDWKVRCAAYLTTAAQGRLRKDICLRPSPVAYSVLHCSHDSTGHTPPSQELLSELSPSEFEDVSEQTLDSLSEKFEDLGDLGLVDSNFDVHLSGGVLTVNLGASGGTYVINKQTPNKQIWLSSPASGPKRYDFICGRWIYKHDGVCLHDLLTTEISEMLGTKVDFALCTHGHSESVRNKRLLFQVNRG